MGAIFQGALERIFSGAAAHRVSDWYWHGIERSSYAAGYAFGISNSKKYSLRGISSQASKDPLPVLDIYGLVPSPTGASIHHRDVAEALAADDRVTQAVEHFDEALTAAQEAGDPSLELKAMLGLGEIAGSRTWSREEVGALMGRIQSPAFQRYADQVTDALTA